MLNLDIALKQENRSPYELSSEEYALIEQLAENSSGDAGIKAQSLLEHFYNIPDCNCVNTSVDENKSSSTSFSDNDYANAMGLKVSVEPNPATNWVAFNYKLPIDCNEAIIIITNTDGKQIDKLKLSDQIHQKVWNTSYLKPGTYIYELISKELKYTGKIVIVK